MLNVQGTNILDSFGYNPITVPDINVPANDPPNGDTESVVKAKARALEFEKIMLVGIEPTRRLPTGAQQTPGINTAFRMDVFAGDDMPPEFSQAISNLHKAFEFRDKEAVLSFLKQNPLLALVASDAPRNIARFFDDHPALILQVVPDSEEPDFGRLYVFIRTERPVEEAITRLRELDMAWWLHVDPSIRRKMSVDIEPV